MISIGSNWFDSVRYPVVVGNRYIEVRSPRAGYSTPSVRVFRYDEQSGIAVEEALDSGSPLTWDHDVSEGTIRLVALHDRLASVTGYVSGGPGDDLVVTLSDLSIEIRRADEILFQFAGNDIRGVPVGFKIDLATHSVAVASNLPPNFVVRFENRIVHILDLVETHTNVALLRNYLLDSCRVMGPAVIAPVGPLGVKGCNFNLPPEAPIGSVVWELPTDKAAHGALVTSDVVFENCSLHSIAFAAPRSQRPELLRKFAG